jgi:predicted 2-oxoglutarate/Fe(II)-dependent dioxygenase YbiX
MYLHSVDLSRPPFWVVDDFFDKRECARFVALIDEQAQDGPAPITTARGPEVRTDVRNNTRVIFDDEQLAQQLWPRARHHVPDPLMGMTPIGLNERFRCYRYTEGMYFRPHFDGAYRRNEREESLLTLIVYLDEPGAGGDTRFNDLERAIVPLPGRALFFQHCIRHESTTLRKGVKHVLRTDVMYRR